MTWTSMNADYIGEPARKTRVKVETDVIVAGGGPAGFSAAIGAAREGVKVHLVESAGCLGGVATSGMMSHWTGGTRGGFYEEIIERSADCLQEDGTVTGGWQTINTEKLKTVMVDMTREAGVELHLHTLACEPVLDGSVITGIICESKSGREAFLGKVIIDATGDGDIAARAGVPFTKGRESDHAMQPMTLMFKVGGVDVTRAVLPGGFEDNRAVPRGNIQDLGKQNLPFPAGHVLLYPSTLPGIVTVNMSNAVGVDGTDASDLTRAEITCREQINPIVDFLREFAPGFERCYVVGAGASVGVRETRHFEGEYMLTENDILEARQFEDWVVEKAHFNFDVHNIQGSGLDRTGVQRAFPQRNHYTISYRCLVPKKIDGLLLAGRMISGTHLAHSNFRVMPICANIGHAAGVAAGLCVNRNETPRGLSAALIQERLRCHEI